MTVKRSQSHERVAPGMSLYTRDGTRKYLNAAELERFLAAAKTAAPHVMTLCLTLAYTGCRISEALELSAASVQLEPRIIAIRTLKKRDKLLVREVPVPEHLIETLDAEHGIATLQRDMDQASQVKLWSCCRTQAWMQVKSVMTRARVSGLQASCKGLRHGFGVHAVNSGVPLNLVQRWLGHAQLSTTAIYADVVGPDERALASRMWQSNMACRTPARRYCSMHR